MSIEKNMNARIQHKHDIEANWNKALNFIPKAGEIIIYDIDENYNYSRFKIGDGVRTINNIEFSKTDLTGYATESYVNQVISNKVDKNDLPKIATDDDVLDLLIETNIIEPVYSNNNEIFTDSEGNIFCL